jgi:hypothetical protein
VPGLPGARQAEAHAPGRVDAIRTLSWRDYFSPSYVHVRPHDCPLVRAGVVHAIDTSYPLTKVVSGANSGRGWRGMLMSTMAGRAVLALRILK